MHFFTTGGSLADSLNYVTCSNALTDLPHFFTATDSLTNQVHDVTATDSLTNQVHDVTATDSLTNQVHDVTAANSLTNPVHDVTAANSLTNLVHDVTAANSLTNPVHDVTAANSVTELTTENTSDATSRKQKTQKVHKVQKQKKQITTGSEVTPNSMIVKECYTQIAVSFSATRRSVWQGVGEFLDGIPHGHRVGDIGCGNGKNMMHHPNLNFEGMDVCPEFIKICIDRGLTVREGDILNIPYDTNYFDHTICIAVIHHLRTREERVKAISELLRVTNQNGKILIYVWSFNQYDATERRKFTTKDEMVPFFDKISGQTFYRYYHLYDMEELIAEVNSVSDYEFEIERSFNDRNNECVILVRK